MNPLDKVCGKGTKKLLRRFHRGGRYHIKIRDVKRWEENGWVKTEHVTERDVGGFCYRPVTTLTELGKQLCGISE